MAYTVKEFFHNPTSTLTYVVYDPQSSDAVIIDPVLDFDPTTGRITFDSADHMIDFIRGHRLTLHHILETHAHADHLSGAQYLKQEFKSAQIGIGAGISEVQHAFKPLLGLPDKFPTDGSQFEYLFSDQETFIGGTIEGQVIFTPGHTPACVSYLIGDNLFTGDTLFLTDVGTGRCDFPGGSAIKLYQSVHEKLFKLPPNTNVYVGHDYPPSSRKMQFRTNIGEQKAHNIHLNLNKSLSDYVQFREARDKTLKPPALINQALLLNLNAGVLPEPNASGDIILGSGSSPK